MKARSLPFSTELSLPLDMATETLAFLGRKGRGKTYGAQRLFELLHDAGVQCVALDPVGNWWSLRVGKDGRSPGLPVYVFGGPRGDVPILPDAGAFVARVIVEKGISVILDVSRFRKAERKRFMTAFAEEFFHLKKDAVSPVHLFVEEAHKFVPQLVRDGEEQMLGAMEDIIRIGRNYGIGASLISQRSASVNKDVLSQVECLVAYQTGGRQDKKAIKDWVEENDEEGVALLQEMKSLQRGEALLWSPSALRVFKKIHVTEKRTLDASSTPKIGEKARAPAKLAKVDLEGIHEAMKEVVASAAENDVGALKRRVKVLEAELAKERAAPRTSVTAETVREVKVPLIDSTQVTRVGALVDKMLASHDRLAQAQQAVVSEAGNLRTMIAIQLKQIDRPNPPLRAYSPVDPVQATRVVKASRVTVEPATNAGGTLPPARQRLIDTLALLARLRITGSRDVLAAWAGVHTRNKAYSNNLGALRSAGYLEGFALTVTGLAAAREIEIPSQQALRERLLDKLPPARRRIVDTLIDLGRPMERDELARALGVHPNNKAFNNNMGALRTRQLITRSWPVRAGDVLFMQGV